MCFRNNWAVRSAGSPFLWIISRKGADNPRFRVNIHGSIAVSCKDAPSVNSGDSHEKAY